MGLDIYVGSFTRYYAGNWETVVQKLAREEGVGYQMIRTNVASDAVTDADQIRHAVLSWRDQLSQGLGSNIDHPLDWDETATAPYFTDKPAWDCYSSLLLWAAYSEHSGLLRPVDCVEDWTKDVAFKKSSHARFKTAFSQLLDVEIWLPHDFSFTFRAADPAGQQVRFGSSIALAGQLGELNRRTWKAPDTILAEWRRNGASHRAPLEIGASFAFSVMTELARQAAAHRLIMKLDY
jgi:hypothetical protein